MIPRRLANTVLGTALALNLLAGAEPPRVLKLTVPDYQVTKFGTLDRVTIPGGLRLLREQGRPEVPYYFRSYRYPGNYRIQEVVLKARSGEKPETTLKLPAVVLEPQPQGPVPLTPGRYPDWDFEWSLSKNPDGSTNLELAVFPLCYDPETGRVRYVTSYEFLVRYVKSSVSLVAARPEEPESDPGRPVRIIATLTNSGASADVWLGALVRESGSGRVLDSLSARRFRLAKGKTEATLEWTPDRSLVGDYLLEVVVRDPGGNRIDQEQVECRLGRFQVEVTSFTVKPEHFKIGERIMLGLTTHNAGQRELSGEGVLRIQHGREVVHERLFPFSGLKPESQLVFLDTWPTNQAQVGAAYEALGYVRYNGTATLVERVRVSTNLAPQPRFQLTPEQPRVAQEIEFDAALSTDPDGKITQFEWDFGDGTLKNGPRVTHSYPLPGHYLVTLRVFDSDGASATVTRSVTVGE